MCNTSQIWLPKRDLNNTHRDANMKEKKNHGTLALDKETQAIYDC